jgi:hypothetical protein
VSQTQRSRAMYKFQRHRGDHIHRNNRFCAGRFLARGNFTGGSRIRVKHGKRREFADSRAMRTQGRKAITFLVITSCAAPCVLTPSRTFDTIVIVPAMNMHECLSADRKPERKGKRLTGHPGSTPSSLRLIQLKCREGFLSRLGTS